MKFLYALIFLALASAVLCDKNQDRYKHKSNKKWEEYKKHHQKSFKHDDEEEKRFKNFLKTDEIIEKNKQALSEGKVSFELEHNRFSDMTEEERKRLTGTKPPTFWKKRSIEKRDTSYVRVNGVAPSSVDWTTKWKQPIRNQGDCGSCWAFATCAAMEFLYFNKTGQVASCSPQYMVDCSSNSQYSTNGCEGGWYGGAINFLKAAGGAPTESSYPYKNAQGSCKSVSSRVFKTNGVSRIQMGSEADLLNAVAFKGPVITCINAVGGFFSYKSGVYTDAATKGTECNHAVVIVGYGSESGKNFWLIRNSWGADWGVNGHIKYARNGVNYGELWDYNVMPLQA